MRQILAAPAHPALTAIKLPRKPEGAQRRPFAPIFFGLVNAGGLVQPAWRAQVLNPKML